ncbi:hypothetical protein IQ244_03055 [Nostoc sp. LEGE 06077]|uniref:alr0857 family protein n=1 Tax=Nostoc sp. LEGE 06077 TaxID=915325 RepID=UPI001880A23D|nr:alr0857 family protein [Nostoc sp. LEGE 06077]MBE9205503.1 hypothetical protein [Nostoc sp. LEGE 06077]
MLKLTYTERSFCLECIPHSLEDWVTQRVIFAMRVGQNLCVEPSTASFLLPVDLPGVDALKAEVKRDDREVMALCVCDSEYVEVTLRGSWLTSGAEDSVGVFITTMSDRTEFFVHKLWQEAQACASVMSE